MSAEDPSAHYEKLFADLVNSRLRHLMSFESPSLTFMSDASADFADFSDFAELPESTAGYFLCRVVLLLFLITI
jgi:hypothetical protein